MASFHRRPNTIFLFGDSLMGGLALGLAANRASRTDPLLPFAAPHLMISLVLRENGLPWRTLFDPDVSYGDFYLAHAGFRAKLEALLASGAAARGDWMIFEDAGPHGSDPDAYQAAWEDVLGVSWPAGVNRAVMTMFDYTASPGSQYDTAFGPRTMNQATRAAAASTGTSVIDMNAAMDAYRASLLADGSDAMLADGVHMNVWGQLRFAGAILGHIGLAGALQTRASLTTLTEANYAALGYGAPGWSAARAIERCAAILG